MLLYPEHRKQVFEKNLLNSDDFITTLNKRIFEYLSCAYKNGDENFISMNDEFTPDEMGRISKMKITRMQLSSNDDDVLLEAIETLRKSLDKKSAKKTDTIDKLNAILMKKRND